MLNSGLYGLFGSMGGGKTARLISEATKLSYGRIDYRAFYPDNNVGGRYREGKITCRQGPKDDLKKGGSIDALAIPAGRPETILDHVEDEVFAYLIDEAHMFDPDLQNVIQEMLGKRKRVIVAGLSSDFGGRPFRIFAYVGSRARKLENLWGMCGEGCGEKGMYNQLWVNGQIVPYSGQEIIAGDVQEEETGSGEKLRYSAMCQDHFTFPELAEDFTDQGLWLPPLRSGGLR